MLTDSPKGWTRFGRGIPSAGRRRVRSGRPRSQEVANDWDVNHKRGIEFANRSTHLKGMRSLVLIGFLSVMALAGCGPKPAVPTAVATSPSLPTHAQPKLPTIRLFLGQFEMSTEMALTPIQQETGMMFRTNMDEMAGMIFPLPYPQRAAFWMTNCPLPLAAAYIDPQGQILEIHELHANDATTVFAEAQNVYYVLEVNQGWFARHHIETGTTVRTERGTLGETFRRPNQ
jgi:uncharacterized protein